MDWNYPQGAGPEGIFEIGRRLAEHIGSWEISDPASFGEGVPVVVADQEAAKMAQP